MAPRHMEEAATSSNITNGTIIREYTYMTSRWTNNHHDDNNRIVIIMMIITKTTIMMMIPVYDTHRPINVLIRTVIPQYINP